jgi:glycosyltransferase involved in cell wall biosynthesis
LIDRFEPSIGGAELMVKALCIDLRARGLDVRVVTRNYTGRLAGWETVDGIPVRRLGRSRLRQVSKLQFIAAVAWHLVRHKESYDVLHVHCCMMETDLLPAYLASRVTRRPFIVHIHNALNVRWMFNPRRSDPLLMGTRPNLLPGWFWKGALRAAVQVITIDPATEKSLDDLGLSNHRRIPNGVTVRPAPPTPSERRAARRKLALPEDAVLVVFAGVLRREKNVITLLRAWELVERSAPGRDLRLVILGAADNPSNSNEEELRRFVSDRGLRSVTFTGFVRNVDEYLVAADCFAFPSLVEGMPMALLEAMATGLPVVVSGIEEHRQLVISEEVGLVVDPTDHEALAASLLLLFDDPEQRARLAHRALRRIDEGFSNEQSVSRIEGVLREVAEVG